jgi:hypothetical protein
MAGRVHTAKRTVMHYDDSSNRRNKHTHVDTVTENPIAFVPEHEDTAQDWSFLWQEADVDENGTTPTQSALVVTVSLHPLSVL